MGGQAEYMTVGRSRRITRRRRGIQPHKPPEAVDLLSHRPNDNDTSRNASFALITRLGSEPLLLPTVRRVSFLVCSLNVMSGRGGLRENIYRCLVAAPCSYRLMHHDYYISHE